MTKGENGCCVAQRGTERDVSMHLSRRPIGPSLGGPYIVHYNAGNTSPLFLGEEDCQKAVVLYRSIRLSLSP